VGHILGQQRGRLRCAAYRRSASDLPWPLGQTNAFEPEPQRLPVDCCNDFQGEEREREKRMESLVWEHIKLSEVNQFTSCIAIAKFCVKIAGNSGL
jgi:hypothetical protein